jgi:hypothetical protein
MPAGRPVSEVPQDKADSLISWIEDGNTLRSWCRIEGNPQKSVIYLWEQKDKEFSGRLARAREIGHDAIAEECVEIIDETPTCTVPDPDGGVSVRSDPAGVQRNKNRVWARLELLKCWNPRKYGAKVDLNHTGTIDLAGRLSAARERKK